MILRADHSSFGAIELMNVKSDIALNFKHCINGFYGFKHWAERMRIRWGCRFRRSFSPCFMPSGWRRRRLESLLELRSRCCLRHARFPLIPGVELLKWRTVGKIGRVGTAAVDTFWRRAIGVFAYPCCMCLIARDALGGLTTEVRWKAKDWQLKHWRTGLVFLYFTHRIMQWHSFFLLFTSRTSIPGWKVTTQCI